MSVPLNFVNLGTFTLGASAVAAATQDVDIYLFSGTVSDKLNLLFRMSPSATVGMSVSFFAGFGAADPLATLNGGLQVVVGGSSVPIYGSNGLTYTHAANPTVIPSPSGGIQSFTIDVLDSMNVAAGPGQGTYLKIRMQNLDVVANSVQIEATYR